MGNWNLAKLLTFFYEMLSLFKLQFHWCFIWLGNIYNSFLIIKYFFPIPNIQKKNNSEERSLCLAKYKLLPFWSWEPEGCESLSLTFLKTVKNLWFPGLILTVGIRALQSFSHTFDIVNIKIAINNFSNGTLSIIINNIDSLTHHHYSIDNDQI